MQHWYCVKSKFGMQRLNTATCARLTQPAIVSPLFHVTGKPGLAPIRSLATVIHSQNGRVNNTNQGYSSVGAVQPTKHKSSKDHRRTQLDQSLSRLGVKDLSALLIATGRPLTGNKSVLTDRLATYLNAIVNGIDKYQLDIDNSSSERNKTSATITPFPQPERQRQQEQNTKGETLNQIKGHMLPQSIISIDIGIRNLAWVELSKDSEILRWSIEDLIGASDDDISKSENIIQTMDTLSDIEQITDPELTEDISATKAKPRTTKRLSAAAKKPKRRKPPALPFDQRSVALRVDEMMRRIVASESIGAIVIEKQRFRTGGMHAILDATFKCGVVEGMIHTWLVSWQNDFGRRRQASCSSAIQQQVQKNDFIKEDFMIESISPRAVAQWWGIGATALKKASENNVILQVKQERKSQKKELISRNKKTQSKHLVEKWLYSGEDGSDTDTTEEERNQSGSWYGSRVRCSPEIKHWFSQEEKRDDLCDSVLQAVAWYEWRRRAIQEAVERSGISETSLTPKDHIHNVDCTAQTEDLDPKGDITKKKKGERRKLETSANEALIYKI